MSDARLDESSRVFAQNMLRHAKAAEMSSVHNAKSFMSTNLALEFRRGISKPTSQTSLRSFLDQLDSKANIWRDLAKQKGWINCGGLLHGK